MNQRSVVIVDADNLVQRLLMMVFDGLGFHEISGFHNIADTLQGLKKNVINPDLLVLDLHLVERQHYECLHTLQSIEFKGYIIIMGAGEIPALDELKRFNSDHLKILGLIEKPVTPAKLHPFIDKMNREIQLELESKLACLSAQDLTAGLASEEFIPYFQPKIDIAQNKVVSFEALARWYRRDGEVSPMNFIPAAEQHGLSFQIDMMIFEKTCQHMQSWQVLGVNLQAAVNLSAKGLVREGAGEHIEMLVNKYKLQLSSFVFELTHITDNGEIEIAMNKLRKLHAKGAQIAMEDPSSLSLEEQSQQALSFSELKIDRKLVKGALNDFSKNSQVESCVELADRLQLKSSCEGVETYEDFAIVKAAGASLAQGFFFSKPLPAKEFLAWVENY